MDDIPSKNMPLISESEKAESGGVTVDVQVQLTPKFEIAGSGGNEDDIVRIIKSHMKELADELGGELAEKLGKIFSNMPLKGA